MSTRQASLSVRPLKLTEFQLLLPSICGLSFEFGHSLNIDGSHCISLSNFDLSNSTNTRNLINASLCLH